MVKPLEIESFVLGGKTVHLIGFNHGYMTEKRVREGATREEQQVINKYLKGLKGSKTFLLEFFGYRSYRLTPDEFVANARDFAGRLLRRVPQLRDANLLPLEPVMVTHLGKLKKAFHKEFYGTPNSVKTDRARSFAFQRYAGNAEREGAKHGLNIKLRGMEMQMPKDPLLGEFRSLVFADTVNTHVAEGGSDHVIVLVGGAHLHSLKRYLKKPELMRKMLAVVPKTSKFLRINRFINRKFIEPRNARAK